MAKYSIRPLISLYNKHADPDKARQMRAYMKDQFDYLGLPSPLRRELTKQFYKAYDYPLPEHVEAVVMEAYRLPQREFRYFALELLVKMREKTGHDAILLYERLITDEPWWDTIDLIAPSLVGFHFQQYPAERNHYINNWIKSGNIWLQRSCILFQLKYKSHTDTRLLSRIILELRDSKEFFIRKAIGWALREYSKTDPGFVIRFVQTNELSGLSQREALKWLERI
ncbi:MAG: DNA alkylation repair protein [Bacteroidales bacterium]|nr:DNA alkylation repair protein [Bacteroidales bacterium]